MPPTLQIKLLGDFAIVDEQQTALGIHNDRQQALLAYLLLHRHVPQPRQRLAFHLWTDSTDAQARSNLRKALSYLRQFLPEPDTFLAIDAKTLQWSPAAPFALDVQEFEAELKAAEQADSPEAARSHLEQALLIYRGDLLPDCEDEWIVPERERLQQMRMRAVQQCMTLLREQQDYSGAIAYGQQLLRIDSLNESAHAALMQLHWLRGDRASALQVYHQCMTMLRDELGVDPGPATRKLYDQILNAEAEPLGDRRMQNVGRLVTSPAPPRATQARLVGRDREWAQIQQWLDSCSAERSTLLLMGEPGIGKTRLLQAVQETVQQQNGLVLWGRGFEAEIVRPYGVWIDALRAFTLKSSIAISDELAYLFSESGATSHGPSDRSHLFDSVVQFISQLCSEQRSVLIVLDDVQWIDEASSALFHYAMRLLGGLPVFFACTARTKELDDNGAVLKVVQALRREQRLLTLPLQPLEPQHTIALMRSVYGSTTQDIPPELARRVSLESGGNPLFVLEISRALLSGEQSYADSLEMLIRDRLQRLDEAARELIPWAAALGQTFDPMTLAHITDSSLSRLLSGIEQLERESLIRAGAAQGREGRYDFAHDIVRQVAYRQLSEPRRCLLHLQIAQKLHQRAGGEPSLAAEVAHHAALGGDRDLASTACLTAAQYSLKLFAYAEAAELAQRGIQYCQSLDQRTRIRLHLELLQVLVLSGVPAAQVAALEAETQTLIQAAHTLGLWEEEATGFDVLMILNFEHSNFADVQRHSLNAAEVGRAANPVVMARMLSSSGSCLAEIGREMTRAEALLVEAQSLAARVGFESTDLYSGLGCVRLYAGDYDEARGLLQRAYQLAQIDQDHWRECWVLSYLAMTELEAGQPAAALPYSQMLATAAAQIQGQGSEAAVSEGLAALANYRLQAEDPAVLAQLERSLVALQQVDVKRMLSYVLSGAAEVDLSCDRPALAAQRAELALHAAKAVNQPSELALSWALLIQSWYTLAEHASAQEAASLRQQIEDMFQSLRDQIDSASISRRARTAVAQTRRLMKPALRARPHSTASGRTS